MQYVLDFEHGLKGKAPSAFERVQYIEQPTARDLAANRQSTMFEAAKLRPVVIDESLTGLDTLLLAREMGYTGVALKACKGQSGTLLMAAAAQKYKMFRCVQDLTCPGAALVHSVGHRRAYSGDQRGGSQCARVRPGGQCGMGEEIPRHLQHSRWLDAHRWLGRHRAVHQLRRRTARLIGYICFFFLTPHH